MDTLDKNVNYVYTQIIHTLRLKSEINHISWMYVQPRNKTTKTHFMDRLLLLDL